MLTDDQFFRIAHVVAESGTCSRLQVGALVTRDNRIIASGYNGTARGLEHCHHDDNKPCYKTVHAEANAILYAARAGVSTNNAVLYTTHMPCDYCAGLIINAGISVVKYELAYRNDAGIMSLTAGGVRVEGVVHATN